MAQLTLSKSELTKQKENLASYRQYLPVLDLKRRQLMVERNKARLDVARYERELGAAIEAAGAALPMLGDARVDLDGLARLAKIGLGRQNIVGARLPVVETVAVEIAPYGELTWPHWVDGVAERLKAAIRLKVEAAVAERRAALLEAAVTKVTQRTNLFEKILIPETKDNIRRLMIYLDDTARAGVVAAKLSKRKREAAAR